MRNEDQLILRCGGHVVVDVPQKAGRVAVGEVIIGSDQQRTAVGDTGHL